MNESLGEDTVYRVGDYCNILEVALQQDLLEVDFIVVVCANSALLQRGLDTRLEVPSASEHSYLATLSIATAGSHSTHIFKSHRLSNPQS